MFIFVEWWQMSCVNGMLVGRVQGIISFQSSSIVKISVYSKINSKQAGAELCQAQV